MFKPAECFKAAIVCPIIAYVAETAIYHHSRHDALIFAAFVAAVPALFGLLGAK